MEENRTGAKAGKKDRSGRRAAVMVIIIIAVPIAFIYFSVELFFGNFLLVGKAGYVRRILQGIYLLLLSLFFCCGPVLT